MDANAIKELRQRLQESQTQFGARFSVSQITVAHWESGRSKPMSKRLLEIQDLSRMPTASATAPRPFRPIQYLGSKLRLAETIATIIEQVAPRSCRVGDLFSGTGVVSSAIAVSHPVTAVDIQSYSAVLSAARLRSSARHFSELLKPEFEHRAREVESQLGRALAPLISVEQDAIAEAKEGRTTLLAELIEHGSLAVFEQRPAATISSYLESALKSSSRNLKRLGLSTADTTALRYFGGPYFSYPQAIALDSILIASTDFKNHSTALAVILSAASEMVNTVGKQFAQPMKLRKADGTTPEILLQRAIRDRSLDTFHVFSSWASRWYAHTLKPSKEHKVVCGDVLDFVSQDESCRAWYADPPYTIDHYSRFYHVLETISLRDSPKLDEMAKRGEITVMRGVYRGGRYQSPFCIPSKAHSAFDGLFSATAKNGAPLVLSYSPYDEAQGNRPRLLTLKEMMDIASKYYRNVSLEEIDEHSHRKLNSKSLNSGIRSNAECLIICEAAR
ncbi:DNA adenine methylase [Herbaspirillum aquaticum]|nr:DNA adenine methylase [Herbaspirillum aquaticum]